MNSFWDKRIPTLLGLFLIAMGVGVTSYLVQIGAIPFLHAAPAENPQDVRITNITDTSFTVTYLTDASVIGSLSFGKDVTLGKIALDDRDQASGIPTLHTIHSITVRALEPKTLYYFSIISGKTTYLNQGTAFGTSTGQTIANTPTSQDPLTGRVVLPTGDVPNEAIVYVTGDNGQTLSTLVRASGIYILPLNTMRTSDFASYLQFTQDTKLQVLAIGNTLRSNVNLLASKSNPVPTITLSNNYDFTITLTPLASSSALPLGFPVFALDKTIQATPEIQTPTKNETFSDSQPVFKGEAPPNSTVSITIHSDAAVNAQVTSDPNGNWIYRPNTPLAPGQHTITITTKDNFGILKTIQQTFTIFESGTQVAEAATPSATLTPTNTPAPIPTATPSPTPGVSVTPTTIISPIVVTPTPTTVASLGLATPVPTAKTKGALLPTGSDSVATAEIVGAATTAVGVLLFFVARGASL